MPHATHRNQTTDKGRLYLLGLVGALLLGLSAQLDDVLVEQALALLHLVYALEAGILTVLLGKLAEGTPGKDRTG